VEDRLLALCARIGRVEHLRCDRESMLEQRLQHDRELRHRILRIARVDLDRISEVPDTNLARAWFPGPAPYGLRRSCVLFQGAVGGGPFSAAAAIRRAAGR